jgi:hypothetical protein
VKIFRQLIPATILKKAKKERVLRLRIHRTYTWEIACSPMEVKYGGPNPMELVAHDQIQYQNPPDPVWNNVEVVEGERPPHPTNYR